MNCVEWPLYQHISILLRPLFCIKLVCWWISRQNKSITQPIFFWFITACRLDILLYNQYNWEHQYLPPLKKVLSKLHRRLLHISGKHIIYVQHIPLEKLQLPNNSYSYNCNRCSVRSRSNILGRPLRNIAAERKYISMLSEDSNRILACTHHTSVQYKLTVA